MSPVDAQAAADLIRRAFAAQPIVLDPPASALGVTAKAIAEHLAQEGGLVAEVNNRLTGAALWATEGDALRISRLAVDPAARRQGIASQLLRAAELEARRRGASRLTLGTRLALAGNRQLFAAAGFRETAFHCHAGYATPTWVELEKQLIG
jgi:GNAT superfamily N-acetyltransferase